MSDDIASDRIASNYYTEVGTHPSPTQEEEVRLFTAYKKADLAGDRAELLLLKARTSDTKLRYSNEVNRHKRDKSALGKLIACGYLKYVIREARKRKPRDAVMLQDLISEGNVGLMKAIERFDIDRGNRFLTYADYWIRVYMQEFVNRSPHTVHVPNHTRKELRKKKKEEDLLIAAGVITRSTLIEPSVGPLDANLHPSTDDTSSGMSDDECNLFKYMDEADLLPRERFVLAFTFGLRESTPRNFSDIAQLLWELDGSIFGPDEIRDLRDGAMVSLRDFLKDKGMTGANDLI